LRCNQDIQLGGLKNTMKYFTSVRVSAEIRIRYLPKVTQKRHRLRQLAPYDQYRSNETDSALTRNSSELWH
jgi:hypothetical protein